MNIDFIHSFVTDARKACEECCATTGLLGSAPELIQLRLAARNAIIDRQGKITAESGRIYDYRVHGAGYSFHEIVSGKQIHFDVETVEGVDRIRFTMWSLLQYSLSIDPQGPPVPIRSELAKLTAKHPEMMHVAERGFDYYLWLGD